VRLEHWFYTVPLRLRSLFRRRRVEEELNEELQYHLEKKTEGYIARGMTPDEARHAAVRAMDGLEQRKEECREMHRVNPIDHLLQDVRYALRTLRKSPGFTSVAVLSLALGIGANTAIFSLIDGLLLRPLQAPQPERLVTLFLRSDRQQAYVTYPIFDEIRKRNEVFTDTFAWSQNDFQTTIGGEVVHVPGLLASGDYFTGLGVAPSAGRTFTPADDRPDGGPNGPVAVISDSFWTRQFQRSPSVIGKPLVVNGVPLTIIGVMPKGFFGAEVATAPQIWVPLKMAGRLDDSGCINSRSCWWLVTMGRLKPGISMAQAEARLRVISPQLMKDTVPDWTGGNRATYLHFELGVWPGKNGWTSLRDHFSDPLRILMLLALVVLLIACANMANLLLARGFARHKEIAVRLAMGAGRWRVIRQLLTESVLISIVGAALGFVFAQWATHLMVALLSPARKPIPLDLHPDWRVLIFTAAAAVSAGMLFGLMPAFRATRVSIGVALKERAHNIRSAEGRLGIGRVLLAAQVALSVLLIAGAGLFAGSLIRLLSLNPGFKPKNLVVIGIGTDRRPEKGEALAALYGRLLERVNTLPGVRAASLLWITPLTNGGWDQTISIPGKPGIPEELRDAYLNKVGSRFFETMGTPLLAGREFTVSDTSAAERVGIINENAVRAWFPNENPIGAHIELDKAIIRIIGVVGNAKYLNLREPEPKAVYFPYSQEVAHTPSMSFAIRTDAGLSSVYREFQGAIREVAPGTPIWQAKTMSEQVSESLSRERLMASLSVFFGLVALLLTAIGLYGILAYAVTRRTGEIGVRMALGAQRHDVISLVLRETLSHVFVGVAVGIAAVLGTSRLTGSLLYGVRPNDPLTMLLAVFMLMAVAAAASYLPARRASRLDPMMALRDE
jgi:predicted permease